MTVFDSRRHTDGAAAPASATAAAARRARATLLLLLALLVAPATSSADRLQDFEAAMGEGRYDEAVTLALAIEAHQPDSAVAAYNVACALARAARADEAVDWLAEAARRGFAGTRSLEDDADLEALRAHPGFAPVMAQVRANAAARFEDFQRLARDARPVVALPPDYDPAVAAPLLVALHGTGGNGAGMAAAWLQPAAALGAIVLAPDALRPVAGTEGFSWVYRDEAEWLVLRMIEQARVRWRIDRVVLTGFSQGANIALMLGQSHPALFDAVIPVAGHYEADVAMLPRAPPRPRWYLLIGDRDPWVDTYDEARRAFEAAGMSVVLERVPRLGHAFPRGRRGERLLTEALAFALASPAPAD